MEDFVHEEEDVDHPIRYLPIGRLYSSTAPCVNNPSGSSNVMSKKVKARKFADEEAAVSEAVAENGDKEKPPLDLDRKRVAEKPLQVYRRRPKKPRRASFFETLARRMEPEPNSAEDLDAEKPVRGDISVPPTEVTSNGGWKLARKKQTLKNELLRLGIGSCSPAVGIYGRQLRGSGGCKKINFSENRRNAGRTVKEVPAPGKEKKWVEVEIKGVDPHTFVGLTCKVFWPMDDDWYRGSVTGYDPTTKQHSVGYEDGDVEHLILMNENIKFHLSSEEMQSLNLNFSNPSTEKKVPNYNEMLALAISFDDCQDLEPGDLVWAKLSGHAMWPAIILNESNVGASRSLKPIRRDQSIPVQFFGTHDFARISLRQAIPFVNGLLSSLHLKCKKTRFYQSLEEAKLYLSNQELPKSMLRLQRGIGRDDCKDACVDDEEGIESCEEFSGDEATENVVEHIKTYPIEIGNLHVTNLGKIVCDSEYFRHKQGIWPEGYTAFRKFTSIQDPKSITSYKMEVLRNPKLKARPLFRVTSNDGDQIDGPNPTVCWKEIYNRIGKKQCNGFHIDVEGRNFQKSGSYMFGFSNPKISQLIQDLPNSTKCLEGRRELPAGYKAVHVDWKDLDRCSVCHMDEEYEDNLFLQCDKCRMMVHARCYGELEPLDGVLWFCNLCRPGAPRPPPPCCLCPVVGGAIKPTTDGRWAHLTCAMWIPETCLLDVKKMEPIDGLSRINKDRWKLLCCICGVPYGACIQCSNSTCRVAYHPLCARAADLCVELEDEDGIHLISLEEDDDHCIRLLSFCKKHRQPSNEHPPADESLRLPVQHASNYVPASNSSGCARCEPYNFFGRRGQKEPQVLAAASAKRLYVENRPYLVSGYRQNGVVYSSFDNESVRAIGVSGAPKLRTPRNETSGNISSMAEKYSNMKASFRKRLAFGKSRIHGFGVFTKIAHKAGDMVIEYTGELVRPSIADTREHRIYNSLVGAGTYMFRIDDERVIDATRAGSIAHLINHSCGPNCYSRVISVNGDEHIIIFAKRDIGKWEELTYDYRFFSIDEQLACYCGFARCRHVVNDAETEEQMAKIWAPRGDLIHWRGE